MTVVQVYSQAGKKPERIEVENLVKSSIGINCNEVGKDFELFIPYTSIRMISNGKD